MRTSSRMLVFNPTPAKVKRNAHFDTLAMLALWPLLNQPAVAIADTARKPRTNLGNFSQMNDARARNSDVGYAIAAILALGAVALFTLPLLGPLLVAVVGLVVVAAVSLGLVLLTSRVFGWGIGAGTSPS